MKKTYIIPATEINHAEAASIMAVSLTSPDGSNLLDEEVDNPDDVQVKGSFNFYWN